MSTSTKPDISIFFPVYKDESTIRTVTGKAISICTELANKFEIVIVNDCSPDRSGEIADELAAQHDFIKVIHHPENMGYGAAVKTGLNNARYEWICLTDGDDEYDLNDLRKLIKFKDAYDLIITFRYKKIYSNKRIFISAIYNKLLRWLFRTNYRDISTGLRLVKKELIEDLQLITNSPFIGAEITIKSMLKGYRVGEVGIQTFPRTVGSGSSTSFRNIYLTIKDMLRVRKEIFSDHYDLPDNRQRS
ncbi:MAG: glycosyltransferase family 2 protein [Flavobacteriales bacterium]|nr:glycosyltransferase family 2 protein [Flavobacteriales bacterium]